MKQRIGVAGQRVSRRRGSSGGSDLGRHLGLWAKDLLNGDRRSSPTSPAGLRPLPVGTGPFGVGKRRDSYAIDWPKSLEGSDRSGGFGDFGAIADGLVDGLRIAGQAPRVVAGLGSLGIAGAASAASKPPKSSPKKNRGGGPPVMPDNVSPLLAGAGAAPAGSSSISKQQRRVIDEYLRGQLQPYDEQINAAIAREREMLNDSVRLAKGMMPHYAQRVLDAREDRAKAEAAAGSAASDAALARDKAALEARSVLGNQFDGSGSADLQAAAGVGKAMDEGDRASRLKRAESMGVADERLARDMAEWQKNQDVEFRRKVRLSSAAELARLRRERAAAKQQLPAMRQKMESELLAGQQEAAARQQELMLQIAGMQQSRDLAKYEQDQLNYRAGLAARESAAARALEAKKAEVVARQKAAGERMAGVNSLAGAIGSFLAPKHIGKGQYLTPGARTIADWGKNIGIIGSGFGLDPNTSLLVGAQNGIRDYVPTHSAIVPGSGRLQDWIWQQRLALAGRQLMQPAAPADAPSIPF